MIKLDDEGDEQLSSDIDAMLAELVEHQKHAHTAEKEELIRRAAADPHLAAMMANRNEALSALNGNDSALKKLAIDLLQRKYPFPRDPELFHAFEYLAFSDPDPNVQSAAMTALAMYANTYQKRYVVRKIERRLAVLVSDAARHDQLRNGAYRALVVLSDPATIGPKRFFAILRRMTDPGFPYLQHGAAMGDWDLVAAAKKNL